MALRSRKEFLRDVRRWRSTLGFAEHITPSNARLYHACESKYITRDEVVLYRDGIAVYITLATASISRKPPAFHITRDEVALYHDGTAVYITPP